MQLLDGNSGMLMWRCGFDAVGDGGGGGCLDSVGSCMERVSEAPALRRLEPGSRDRYHVIRSGLT